MNAFDAVDKHADTLYETEIERHSHTYVTRFEQVAQQRGYTPLTAREIEVAVLFLRGFSARAIAARLTISFETVRVHRKHVYSKLNVRSQSELFSLFDATHHDSKDAEVWDRDKSERPRWRCVNATAAGAQSAN
ncbi:DNA-binding NarL/FixJ family response regulator [Paraburkholderia youngii]